MATEVTSPLSRSRGKWIRRRRRRRRQGVRGREGICLVYGEIAFVTISLRARANIFALSLENRTERVNTMRASARKDQEKLERVQKYVGNLSNQEYEKALSPPPTLVLTSCLLCSNYLQFPIYMAPKLLYSNPRNPRNLCRESAAIKAESWRSGNAQTLSLLRHLPSLSPSLSGSLQSEKQ